MALWGLLFTTFACLQVTLGYNILVAPLTTGFNSRLRNMQKMADMLALDGHEVSLLMNTKVQEYVISKHAKVIEYFVPEDIKDFGDVNFEDMSMRGFNAIKVIESLAKLESKFCHHMMKDTKILNQLNTDGFDLLIADMSAPCNQIVASFMNITTMWYQNYLVPSHNMMFYPLFPSFTCVGQGVLCTSDDMTFLQKVGNFAGYLAINHIMVPHMANQLEVIAKEEKVNLKVPLLDTYRDSVVIVNTNFVLDSPLPLMPHVFPISGMFHKKAQPLSQDFEAIMRRAEPHGVVLLSFGTLISKFDQDKAEVFARVFGRLKQQVIWKFVGKPPKALQPNTHLVDWFPQNDLLANPLVKLFITHCGISSTFETAYHGVPVIAMPLFCEQDVNAAKLTQRVKIGTLLDFQTLTETQLEEGIREVLDNPIYKENAKKTSYLLNDQLVSPQHQLKHLVNFTIKSGGAPHLFHPYAGTMNWLQFYGLDVIFFLLLLLILVITVIFLVTRWILKKLWSLLFGMQGKTKTS